MNVVVLSSRDFSRLPPWTPLRSAPVQALLGSQGKGEGTQKEKRLLHSSRFKSAVCSGGCGWTALFLRYAASVNWKPGCLAATRQERIPEADKEKSAQHKVMTPM